MKNRVVFLVAFLAYLSTGINAEAQIAVISESVVEREAHPGEAYEGRLVVLNTSKTPQEAKIYQSDYQFFADGRNNFGSPGSTVRSNARWITFSPARVSLVPGGQATITYRVSVPGNVQLRGSYWSVLMVETISSASAESSVAARREIRVGLQTTIRYGTQLVTNFGTSGTSAVRFDSIKATVDPRGQKGVSFDFANTGERAHRLAISLQLYSASGQLVKTVEQKRGLLFPGTSARQRFDLGALPAGTYKALIVADAGGDEMFGGEYTLRF
jgi:hypothetical protein